MSDAVEDVEPTDEELAERLQEAKDRNQGRAQELAKYGRLDPAGVMLNRLEVLLQSIFDERSRLVFEIRFEEMMEGVIEDALAQAKTQQLLAPPPPGTPLPGFGGL